MHLVLPENVQESSDFVSMVDVNISIDSQSLEHFRLVMLIFLILDILIKLYNGHFLSVVGYLDVTTDSRKLF
jgi:hypothetical protein